VTLWSTFYFGSTAHRKKYKDYKLQKQKN